MKNFVQTNSGRAIHFLNPDPKSLEIQDVALGLSRQCRYAGQTKFPYSVAQHCVLLFDWAEKNLDWFGAKALRTLLMHDASEAFLPDIPGPMKKHLPDYCAMEEKLQAALAERFDLIYPFTARIKELDKRILVNEREQVMNPTSFDWGLTGVEPLHGVKVRRTTSADDYAEFLRRWSLVNV